MLGTVISPNKALVLIMLQSSRQGERNPRRIWCSVGKGSRVIIGGGVRMTLESRCLEWGRALLNVNVRFPWSPK